MRNYAETCKGICGYNLVYNFFMQLAFVITKFSFSGALFKRILACEGVISKRYFLERNCSSPCNLSYDIQLIQWSGCFRKVNIYMTYYIKQPRITQEVRVIIKGQPYVTQKDILSFQVASGRFLLVVRHFRLFQVVFLLVVSCFRSFQVVLQVISCLLQVVSCFQQVVSGRFLLVVGRFRLFLAHCRSFQVVSGRFLLVVGCFRLFQVVSGHSTFQ